MKRTSPYGPEPPAGFGDDPINSLMQRQHERQQAADVVIAAAIALVKLGHPGSMEDMALAEAVTTYAECLARMNGAEA